MSRPFNVRRPTPYGPTSANVLLLNGGILTTSSYNGRSALSNSVFHFDWYIFLRFLLAILKIITKLNLTYVYHNYIIVLVRFYISYENFHLFSNSNSTATAYITKKTHTECKNSTKLLIKVCTLFKIRSKQFHNTT